MRYCCFRKNSLNNPNLCPNGTKCLVEVIQVTALFSKGSDSLQLNIVAKTKLMGTTQLPSFQATTPVLYDPLICLTDRVLTLPDGLGNEVDVAEQVDRSVFP